MAERSEQMPFPGQASIMLPPIPRDKTAKAMYTAHRVDGMLFHLAHAAERIQRAKVQRKLRRYFMIHVNNHLSHALENAHDLVIAVRRNYPAEAKEFDALTTTITPLQKIVTPAAPIALTPALTPAAKAATFAHLLQTILYDLGHAKRHALLMLEPDPEALWVFNYDHAHKHMKGAFDHCFKLSHHIRDNYPAEARWLNDLDKAEDPDDPFTALSARLALKLTSGPIISKTEAGYRQADWPDQTCGNCSMFSGNRCSLVDGSIEASHVCDRWKGNPVKLAVPATSSPRPGPRDQYGLHQIASQTVSPSPPLPPKVPLPTAREVRALISQVPNGIDITLSNSTRKFLEAAAVKLEKDDVVAALAALRGAQASLYAASKKDQGAGRPATYGPSLVPPAEQSSALARMQQAYLEQAQAWRKIGTEVARLIDRVRRNYFAGRINGYLPNQRI